MCFRYSSGPPKFANRQSLMNLLANPQLALFNVEMSQDVGRVTNRSIRKRKRKKEQASTCSSVLRAFSWLIDTEQNGKTYRDYNTSEKSGHWSWGFSASPVYLDPSPKTLESVKLWKGLLTPRTRNVELALNSVWSTLRVPFTVTPIFLCPPLLAKAERNKTNRRKMPLPPSPSTLMRK